MDIYHLCSPGTNDSPQVGCGPHLMLQEDSGQAFRHIEEILQKQLASRCTAAQHMTQKGIHSDIKERNLGTSRACKCHKSSWRYAILLSSNKVDLHELSAFVRSFSPTSCKMIAVVCSWCHAKP